MAAEQAKDRGNKSFATGNYDQAIASFSEAIALHNKSPSENSKPYVYYSNRSAAYLKKGDGMKALQDANKCIEIKPDWVKGYSRKGAALYHMGKATDAYRAYQDGLKLDPTNAALQDGLQSVEKMLTSGTNHTATASTTTPSSSPSLKTFLVGNKTAKFQLMQYILRQILLFSFISYFLPIFLSSYGAYNLFFKVTLFNHLSYLAFTHGKPQWNAMYAQRLMLDPTVQSFFFCLIFWVSTPHFMAMIPIMMIEMVHLCAYLSTILQLLGLLNQPALQIVIKSGLDPLLSNILSEPSWSTLSNSTKWARIYQKMPQLATNIEVAIGLGLLLEVLTPSRNFLLTILYWQLLRVRYMISPQLQMSFRQLNASILSLTQHPRCPAIIGSLYGKIQAFAVRMTDPSTQQGAGAGGGGIASSCSIM